jgi:hypothetical protein
MSHRKPLLVAAHGDGVIEVRLPTPCATERTARSSARASPLRARGAALNEAVLINPRATQRTRHEGSGPNDITTDYAVSAAMRRLA